jgi:hypothetical protein
VVGISLVGASFMRAFHLTSIMKSHFDLNSELCISVQTTKFSNSDLWLWLKCDFKLYLKCLTKAQKLNFYHVPQTNMCISHVRCMLGFSVILRLWELFNIRTLITLNCTKMNTGKIQCFACLYAFAHSVCFPHIDTHRLRNISPLDLC